MNDGRVLPAFMSQALRGEPLTVFGDGSQTRSFCYVDDLVEGIWRLLGSDERLPVNLGNPQEMTIRQFADAVLKATGSNSEFTFKPLPVDDPRVRRPDISKARSLLDWQPRVNLEEGLGLTNRYFAAKVGRRG